jgi:hypothetical protein
MRASLSPSAVGPCGIVGLWRRRANAANPLGKRNGARPLRIAPRFRFGQRCDQKIARLSTAPLMKAAATAEATRVRSMVIGIPLS